MTGGVSYTIPNTNAITTSHDLQVGGVMTMNATWGGADGNGAREVRLRRRGDGGNRREGGD